MHWHTPNSLWLLWLLPIVGWLLYRAQNKRQAAARVFVTGSMRARLMPDLSRARRWTKAILLLAGLAALVVATGRPKYGVYYEQVTQRGVDLFILLDVSRSMLAQDIAPNRLERAKADILDLLQRVPRDRVGLVVFAGKPVARVPLTNDHAFFRQILRDVDTETAPIGGSLIGDAIRMALAAMGTHSDRDQVMVLISDGEDHDSFPVDAAKLAAERGVKIITVGLGDIREGARIPEQADGSDGGYVKDKDGQEHWSHMNEELLKQIALTTSGAYVPARTMAYDLGQIYDDHLSGLTRSELRSEKRQRFREQYQWFAALGLVLLVGESLVSRARVTAALVAICLVASSTTVDANDAISQTRAGLKAFDAGEFAKAAELFAAAAKSSPDDPRIVFNQACATAAGEAPAAARDLFYAAALARDVRLSADSHYNLGCLASTEAEQILGADPLQADQEQRANSLERITQAMGHFRDALDSDSSHVHARHNLETLRVWVKQMKALWEQQDRQQQQAGQNALQMLKDLDARQLVLRALLGEQAELPDSPQRQQQIDDIHEQQRHLVDDVAALKQKLLDQFASATPGPPPFGVPSVASDPQAQTEQAFEVWTDRLRRNFTAAADRILAQEFHVARQSQRDSLEDINQLYIAIAPFSDILPSAISDQKSRIRQTAALIPSQTSAETATASAAGDATKATAPDPDQLGWRQQRIDGWTAALVAKAEVQLPMLEQSLAAQQSGDADDPNVRSADPRSPDPASAPTDDLTPWVESMRRALELGPQVRKLAREAAQHLRESAFETALPKQKEALKLLKQIAAQLPQDNDQSQNQNQNEGQGNQDHHEQNQESQDRQNQNDQDRVDQTNRRKEQQEHTNSGNHEDQPQPDPDQQDDQQTEQNTPADEEEDAEGGSTDQQPDLSQSDIAQPEEQRSEPEQDPDAAERRATAMNSARIESILQRVRERERQHRQVQKKLRRLLQRRTRPERDW